MGWGVGGGGVVQVLISGGKGPGAVPTPPAPVASLPLCPQSSSLCLWGISLVFCMAESVFAVRCSQLAHQLLELRPWLGESSHHMVRPALPSAALTPLLFWEPPSLCRAFPLENWGDSVLPRTKGRSPS